MNGNEWKVGDVLFMRGDGCYPTLFVAKALPGSYTSISRGCYSPDNKNCRKATVEDADARIGYQIEAVNREMKQLQHLFEMREKIQMARKP